MITHTRYQLNRFHRRRQFQRRLCIRRREHTTLIPYCTAFRSTYVPPQLIRLIMRLSRRLLLRVWLPSILSRLRLCSCHPYILLANQRAQLRIAHL